MKVLSRIWADIRSGENLDLYATIVVAFAVVIFTLLNFNIDRLIAPITLATLGILATSALANRHKLGEVLAKIGQSQSLKFDTTFPDTFIHHLGQAKDLWVMGTALRRAVNSQYSLFENILKHGGSIKFILVHPSSQACAMAAIKHFPRVRTDIFCAQVENTLEQLCALKKKTSGQIEIRTTDVLPGFTIFAVDPNTDSGLLYVSYLPFESSSEHRPKMVLGPSGGLFYNTLRQELFTYWENSSVWESEARDLTQ